MSAICLVLPCELQVQPVYIMPVLVMTDRGPGDGTVKAPYPDGAGADSGAGRCC